LIRDVLSPLIDDNERWSHILQEKHEAISQSIKKSLFAEMPKANKVHIPFLRDDKNSSFLAFENTIVKVSKDGIECLPFGSVPEYILKSDILDKSFDAGAKSQIGDFQKFFYRLAGLG